jgi:hypothetical protein
MTSLSLTLSAALQATLNPTSVNAYVVHFLSSGTAVWTELASGGTVQPTVSVPMPSSFVAGKVYFVIQDQVGGRPDVRTTITQESDLSWLGAGTAAWTSSNPTANLNYRYDSFELTLTPSPNDVGNLTSVNGWGLPMSLSVTYSDGTTQTRGYNLSGQSMFGQLQTIAGSTLVYDWASGGALTGPRMGASPTEAISNNLPGYTASDWNPYIAALEGMASTINVAGYFNGAKDADGVWHNAGFFSYQASWDGTYFWLEPQANSQIKGYIRITPSELANSIYETNGHADIFLDKAGAPYISGMDVAANNQWGEVFTQLLTGFSAGYYGATGQPTNTQLTAPIDLSKNWNWDPTYAFGQHHDTTSPSVWYDTYSQLFFNQTNSYGGNYSDNLMQAFAQGGPLIPIANSNGQDVSQINITLYDDSDTPAGYTPPTIYNNAATAPVAATENSGLNFVLNVTNGQMVLTDLTYMSVGVYSGTSGGVPQFNTATFDFTSQTGTPTLFANWRMTNVGGTWKLESFPGTQPLGSILISQLQLPPADAEYGWYQITIGSSGSHQKIYNLYLKSHGDGMIYNSGYTGQADAIAIDGLATIATPTPQAPQQFINTFTVNMLYSNVTTIDPFNLSRITDQSFIKNAPLGIFPTPAAPVVGSLETGQFEQLAPPGAQDPAIGSLRALAFGWNGADTDAGNNISAYTNKVAALDWVDVLVVGKPLQHLRAQADLDGQWTTKAIKPNSGMGNGHYKVLFNEYDGEPTSGSSHIVAKTSAMLEFDVRLTALPLGASSDGDALVLSRNGSQTDGNWIRLEAAGSTLLNGILLVYTTDSQDRLIGRDGNVGVSLDDAVVARIGSVAADDGTFLFTGRQSVYLLAGEEMHFAILTGNGELQLRPDLRIDGSGTLSVSVNGLKGSLRLEASVDNTLSNDAMLAGSQRQHDQAWMYLENNASVSAEFAGSATNVNTVHVVKFDVDTSTGAWSVGGVAYGNTEAFRAAVQANWDAGIAVQNGNGTFYTAANWNVSGDAGFYVPVLKTQGGDVFVIGTANVDGREHIRIYGQNTFGFEDLRADQGSDFDYNDMIMRLHWDGM